MIVPFEKDFVLVQRLVIFTRVKKGHFTISVFIKLTSSNFASVNLGAHSSL